MRLSVDFLPHGRNAAPEEAATVSRIRIMVGNRVATDRRAPGQRELIDHIVAPAYPLAEALSYRWWTLIYGRGRVVRLRSMRAGFALPDISITGLGNGYLEINCEPYMYENPPIEFITKAFETVSTDDLQNTLSEFLEIVLGRLSEQGINSLLADRWQLIKESIANPEETEFCRAAGALGVDPYMCTNDVAAFIESASSLFESDDLEEFLAGIPPESGSNAISWLKQAERQSGEFFLLPAIEDCRREVAFRKASVPPWTTGYSSARKVRRFLRLSETEPVEDLKALATRLGNPRFRATEPSPKGLRGISRVQPQSPQAIVGGSRHPKTLLFAVVRTFGDAIHFGGPHRSPVTDRVGTYRQQLGRAFAAEFLAPVQAVIDMDQRGDPIDEIAENFGVSEIVISHQLENRENALAA
jgi:hypothetical protein